MITCTTGVVDFNVDSLLLLTNALNEDWVALTALIEKPRLRTNIIISINLSFVEPQN